jgi:hypothetical protein
MASADYQIVLILMTVSMAINVWLYQVNVRLDKTNRKLTAINARYSAYQDNYFKQ